MFLDLTDVEELSFEPIPAGTYKVCISESEMVTPQSGGKDFLKIKFEIVDGDYEGRVFFENYNVFHENPEAAEVSRRLLKSVTRAIGIDGIDDDPAELIDHVLKVKLVIKKDKKTGGDFNSIAKTYSEDEEPNEKKSPTKKAKTKAVTKKKKVAKKKVIADDPDDYEEEEDEEDVPF